MAEESTTYNIDGLEKIVKALKAKTPRIRVGILGGWNARSGSKSGNASIGAVHEYGDPSRGIPQRSFLRMPIATKLNSELSKANMFNKQMLKDILEAGDFMSWSRRVGLIAEKCVLDAFNSGGFGTWPAWKNPSYQNNTGMLLVDSTQLRDSISSEVVE